MSESGPQNSRGLRRLLDPDMLVGMSAVVIGVCALFVSIYEARVMREELRATFWPLISTGIDNSGGDVALVLDNSGTGPAIFERVRMRYDGRPVTNWRDLYSAGGRTGGNLPVFTTTSWVDTALLPGERLQPIRVQNSEINDPMDILFTRILLEVYYCSVVGECWLMTAEPGGIGSDRRAVEACPDPDPELDFIQ